MQSLGLTLSNRTDENVRKLVKSLYGITTFVISYLILSSTLKTAHLAIIVLIIFVS
jgi:hypothetical protein